jgi:hypothetical protein
VVKIPRKKKISGVEEILEQKPKSNLDDYTLNYFRWLRGEIDFRPEFENFYGRKKKKCD